MLDQSLFVNKKDVNILKSNTPNAYKDNNNKKICRSVTINISIVKQVPEPYFNYIILIKVFCDFFPILRVPPCMLKSEIFLKFWFWPA